MGVPVVTKPTMLQSHTRLCRHVVCGWCFTWEDMPLANAHNQLC